MSAAFELLRVGDAFWIDDVEYVAVGCADLRADDEEWREWLLAPQGLRADEALRSDRHRWLSHAQGDGLRLWSPIALPDTANVAALKPGQGLRYRDRDYRLETRYRVRKTAIFGDLGDDASTQGTSERAELRTLVAAPGMPSTSSMSCPSVFVRAFPGIGVEAGVAAGVTAPPSTIASYHSPARCMYRSCRASASCPGQAVCWKCWCGKTLTIHAGRPSP